MVNTAAKKPLNLCKILVAKSVLGGTKSTYKYYVGWKPDVGKFYVHVMFTHTLSPVGQTNKPIGNDGT